MIPRRKLSAFNSFLIVIVTISLVSIASLTTTISFNNNSIQSKSDPTYENVKGFFDDDPGVDQNANDDLSVTINPEQLTTKPSDVSSDNANDHYEPNEPIDDQVNRETTIKPYDSEKEIHRNDDLINGDSNQSEEATTKSDSQQSNVQPETLTTERPKLIDDDYLWNPRIQPTSTIKPDSDEFKLPVTTDWSEKITTISSITEQEPTSERSSDFPGTIEPNPMTTIDFEPTDYATNKDVVTTESTQLPSEFSTITSEPNEHTTFKIITEPPRSTEYNQFTSTVSQTDLTTESDDFATSVASQLPSTTETIEQIRTTESISTTTEATIRSTFQTELTTIQAMTTEKVEPQTTEATEWTTTELVTESQTTSTIRPEIGTTTQKIEPETEPIPTTTIEPEIETTTFQVEPETTEQFTSTRQPEVETTTEIHFPTIRPEIETTTQRVEPETEPNPTTTIEPEIETTTRQNEPETTPQLTTSYPEIETTTEIHFPTIRPEIETTTQRVEPETEPNPTTTIEPGTESHRVTTIKPESELTTIKNDKPNISCDCGKPYGDISSECQSTCASESFLSYLHINLTFFGIKLATILSNRDYLICISVGLACLLLISGFTVRLIQQRKKRKLIVQRNFDILYQDFGIINEKNKKWLADFQYQSSVL